MEKKIRFGVVLLQEGGDWGMMRQHWQLADMLGYDHAWPDDHLLTVRMPHGNAQPDCWMLLGALAEVTKRIRIGVLVTCYAFRNPALLANMAATLDRVSNGRLEFAVGAGWNQQEFEAYGYEFPPLGVRFAQLEEAIQIYQAVWTQEKASFQGEYFKVKELTDSPKPVQQPYPRFWIGGGGEQKTLKLVAKYADVWNSYNTGLDAMAHKIEVLKRHCRDVGRNFDEITLTWYGDVLIDEDEERVWERPEADLLRRRAEQRKVDWTSATTGILFGTPEQIAAKIHRYIDLGVTEFICIFGQLSDTRSTRLFAETVFPQFGHPVGQPF